MIKRRKPDISLEQANLLAAEYIAAQDLKGWRFEIVEAHRARDSDNWTVIVERFSPEGGVVDGPLILIVNGETGEVRTFESYFE